MVGEGLRRTGYDEVSLTSLSTADFSGIERVVADVVNDPVNRGQVSVSLPSLRVDAFTVGIAATGGVGAAHRPHVRSRGGSWRLRTVINKLITEDDLYGAVESAYSQGWTRMKLYFLTGLPTEQDDRHARDRGAGRRMRRDRQAVHDLGPRSPSRSAASCPSPTLRSSGSARTQSRSCTARSACCATRRAQAGASSSSGTTRGRRWPRASPAVAIAASAR